MKHLKRYNESKDHETLSMFKHLWDDITDDDNFFTEFQYDSTFKCYTINIHCNKHNIGKEEDGFTIKELGDRLLLPFIYSSELGIRIDFIGAREIGGRSYFVEDCFGHHPTLEDVIKGDYTIVEFLEEWERDYIKDGKLIELSFTFLTLAYGTQIITYNESFRPESIKDDIMDMSLDVQDDGFIVVAEDTKDTYYTSFGYSPDFSILISRGQLPQDYTRRKLFNISDIKEFILRVNEYSKTTPCKIQIYAYDRYHNNKHIQDEIKKDVTIKDGDITCDYKMIEYVIINVRPFGLRQGYFGSTNC